MGEPALGVEMPGDIKECDEARVALSGVEPVPYPGIRGDVGLAAYPYIEAGAGVVEHGKEDEGPFNERAKGDGLDVVGDLIGFGAGDGNGAVGPEKFGARRSNGHASAN